MLAALSCYSVCGMLYEGTCAPAVVLCHNLRLSGYSPRIYDFQGSHSNLLPERTRTRHSCLETLL